MAVHADPFDVRDRVAVVTGASSGIGAHFVRTLARAGASVLAVARRADRLDALVADLPNAVAASADITDDAAAETVVSDALARWGRIDILINNAGMSDGPARAESEEPELFRRVVELNLNAVFNMSRLVSTSMIEQGSGSIINIASVHGFVGSAPNTQAAYAASKAGVVNLTRELALQWARHGIRVNAIAPGYFATELTEEMIDTESGTAWITKNTPMRRVGELSELDGPLLLLASDAGSYMTGTTVVADGGWLAR